MVTYRLLLLKSTDSSLGPDAHCETKSKIKAWHLCLQCFNSFCLQLLWISATTGLTNKHLVMSQNYFPGNSDFLIADIPPPDQS